MKIEKLYTLSQFVDEIPNLIQNCDLWYYFIDRYNDLLKQPLKKEMLVNPYGLPTHDSCPPDEFDNAEHMFEEAEKKVIFKGWNQSMYHKYEVISGTDYIDFSNQDYPKLSRRNSIVKSVQILHDLAEATNGALEINIDL